MKNNVIDIAETIENSFDIIVIGGGPAGIAAAVEADKCGKTVLLIEREARLGGILKQCIHDGFGVTRFGEKLTGPEYAQRYIDFLKEAKNVKTSLFSFVLRVERVGDVLVEGNLPPQTQFSVTFVDKQGVHTATCQKLILATGCRERTRNAISIQGDRGAGVYTAGCAQHMVNLLGLMPSKKCVILGSGDIGLVMARRLTLEGATVLGVYEAKPTPSGLSRNIHQCLKDFDIPLHLSTTVTRVCGNERLTGVYVSKVDQNMKPVGEETYVPCDTLILAVGLIPENEIAAKLNVPIYANTKGAYVDQSCETLVEGVFCCGNALHVNDLVDFVSESGEIAGKAAASVKNKRNLINIQADANFLYNVPQQIDIANLKDKVVLFFRSKMQFSNKTLCVCVDGEKIFTKKYRQLLPPEMERVVLELDKANLTQNSLISLKLED